MALKAPESPNFSQSSESSSDDNDVIPIRNFIQNLGFPPNNGAPSLAKVTVENSSDVHFGDKNIYHGPVTIKQVVYSNGDASIGTKTDDSNDNVQSDNNIKETKLEENIRSDCNIATLSRIDKGFVWLQNFFKHHPLEITIFLILVVIFVFVLTLVLVLNHPFEPERPAIGGNYDNKESDGYVKPINYNSDLTNTSQNGLRLVSRFEWLAQPPVNETTPLNTPVPYVIIHHTATENCSSQAQCVFFVRYIQTFHIESKGWFDIGYNFLVGGDGAVYQGRGWTVEGAHLLGWNHVSIGIAFIGTFISRPPSDIQLATCRKLIGQGIDLGYIRPNYTLLGARQLSGTESPGTALFDLIKTWPHWKEKP